MEWASGPTSDLASYVTTEYTITVHVHVTCHLLEQIALRRRAGSEMLVACTTLYTLVAIMTRQPPERNDGHSYTSCGRPLIVKDMRT